MFRKGGPFTRSVRAGGNGNDAREQNSWLVRAHAGASEAPWRIPLRRSRPPPSHVWSMRFSDSLKSIRLRFQFNSMSIQSAPPAQKTCPAPGAPRRFIHNSNRWRAPRHPLQSRPARALAAPALARYWPRNRGDVLGECFQRRIHGDSFGASSISRASFMAVFPPRFLFICSSYVSWGNPECDGTGVCSSLVLPTARNQAGRRHVTPDSWEPVSPPFRGRREAFSGNRRHFHRQRDAFVFDISFPTQGTTK